MIHASKSPWNDVHKPFNNSMPLGNTSTKHKSYHRIRFRFRRLSKHQERKLRQRIRKQLRQAHTTSPNTSNDTSKSPSEDIGASSLARSLQAETQETKVSVGSPSFVRSMSKSCPRSHPGRQRHAGYHNACSYCVLHEPIPSSRSLGTPSCLPSGAPSRNSSILSRIGPVTSCFGAS